MKYSQFKFTRNLIFLISLLFSFLLLSCEKKNVSSETGNSAYPSQPAGFSVKKWENTSGESFKTGYPDDFDLPEIEGVKWETNFKERPFASNEAQKGGVYKGRLSSYPLTFRLYGPESNSGDFVSVKRSYALMSLIKLHPITFNYIPELATHWAVMEDQRTVYFRLDPDALWSDGEKITADNYVYSIEFFTSDFLQAPFYKQYFSETFETIEKIDDYTLKVVLRVPSWRAVYEANISPVPKHAMKLDENWITDNQWVYPPVPGPYKISSFTKGETVEFTRIKNWWGENKTYFKNMYNFDKLNYKVIREDNTALQNFVKGDIDFYSPKPEEWVRKSNFDEIKKNYVFKRQIRYQSFNGAFGIFFNNSDNLIQDRDIRLAAAHLFDFDTMNRSFMFDLYERRNSFFSGIPPYDNPGVKSPEFNLELAEEILDKAGWKRTGGAFRSKDGKELGFELIYARERYDNQLPFYKETAAKAGINLKLKKVDPPTLFKSLNEKNYQAAILSFGGGYYPSPRQFFHTETIAKQTNNMNMFGNAEMDKLIVDFEENLDEQVRVKAYNRIEEIINEAALNIFFWRDPNQRFFHWGHIAGPEEYITISGRDFDYLWFDQKRYDQIQEAKKAGKALQDAPSVDSNPYGL